MLAASEQNDQRMRLARTLVLVAFLLLAAVASLAIWLQAFQVAHTVSSTVQMAHRADSSTYLVGEVAHRVDDITEALEETPGETTIVSAQVRVAKDLERLDQAMQLLPSFLDEEDAALFAEVTPRIEKFKAAVIQVAAHSGTYYTLESRRLFKSGVLPVVDTLEAPLDQLIDLNKAQSQRLLSGLEHDLKVMRQRQLMLGGAFIGFLAVVAFATVRLIDKQHLALTRRLAEIERANRDLDAFAGRVAHDLRGPLTPIVLGAARLRTEPDGREAAEEIAARIMKAAERANTLIEALLAFSRAAYTGQEAGLEGPCCVETVVERALDAVRETANAACVELASDVSSVWVAIDGSLLEQVLDNLLSNAIRYMGTRTVRQVSVRVHAVQSIARFEVVDTGPGVPATERERVFEPFFRLNPELRTGIGLGLATAKRIVESRGGAIGVDRAACGGALFWFTLPAASEPHSRWASDQISAGRRLH
jgi:signal transduction histidine kinase